jgi:hypothetical protein
MFGLSFSITAAGEFPSALRLLHPSRTLSGSESLGEICRLSTSDTRLLDGQLADNHFDLLVQCHCSRAHTGERYPD